MVINVCKNCKVEVGMVFDETQDEFVYLCPECGNVQVDTNLDFKEVDEDEFYNAQR